MVMLLMVNPGPANVCTKSISESVSEFIGKKGFDQVYGARPLKRVIQKEIYNPLSDMVLKNQITVNIWYIWTLVQVRHGGNFHTGIKRNICINFIENIFLNTSKKF